MRVQRGFFRWSKTCAASFSRDVIVEAYTRCPLWVLVAAHIRSVLLIPWRTTKVESITLVGSPGVRNPHVDLSVATYFDRQILLRRRPLVAVFVAIRVRRRYRRNRNRRLAPRDPGSSDNSNDFAPSHGAS